MNFNSYNGKMYFNYVTNVEDMIPYLPVNYEVKYNVEISCTCYESYTHFVDLILTPNKDGMGKGWDTLQDDIIFSFLEIYEEAEFIHERCKYYEVENEAEREIEEFFSHR